MNKLFAGIQALLAYAVMVSSVLAQSPLPIDFANLKPLEMFVKEPAVRVEIDATDEQYGRSRDLLIRVSEERLRLVRNARVLRSDEASVYLTTESRRIQLAALAEFKNLLKPNQHSRLYQIAFQRLLRSLGVSTLQKDPVPALLELTDEELAAWKPLLQRESQRRRERGEQLIEAQTEAVFNLLTEEQRARFQELYGPTWRATATHRLQPDQGFGPMLDLIRFADVRQELEVLDEQYAQISKLHAQVLNEYRAAERTFNPIRKSRRDAVQVDGAQEAFEAKVQSLHAKEAAQLEPILLPHQIKRLQQIVFQARAHAVYGDALRSPFVAAALGLSKDQQQALNARMPAEAAKLREELDKFWTESVRVCIEALPEQKRANYYRLAGREFKPAAN